MSGTVKMRALTKKIHVGNKNIEIGEVFDCPVGLAEILHSKQAEPVKEGNVKKQKPKAPNEGGMVAQVKSEDGETPVTNANQAKSEDKAS